MGIGEVARIESRRGIPRATLPVLLPAFGDRYRLGFPSDSMHIHCVGLNHHSAPVSLRERLSFDRGQLRATLARCGCGDRESAAPLTELVVLSTCNRVEMYAVTSSGDETPLIGLFCEVGDLDPGSIGELLYSYRGIEAVQHLYRVACGLDSMVLGEPQILGQVADSYAQALSVGSAGLVLSRAFQGAIHAGKRAHSETSISVNPATVSSVAVHLVASVVPSLEEARVLVVGAGEMAELAVEALRKRSVGHISVINRTVARAEELARRWQAEARPFEALERELGKADIVISSTAAPHTIFSSAMVSRAMASRSERSLTIIDIAVPRDVEPEAGQVPGVRLYDIDDLESQVRVSLGERRSQVPQVEAIIAQELGKFDAWFESLAIRPVIKAMREQAERFRRQEVERTLRRLESLDDREAREAIETLTKALVKKLLHAPTLCLKEQSLNGNAAQYALIARELFGIDAAVEESAEGGE